MIAETFFQERVARYRRQADEARSKAAQAAGDTRAALLDVAAVWDRLAELEEKNPQPLSD